MGKKHRRNRPYIHPAPKNSVLHVVSEMDRMWFEVHPGEDQYVRPFVAGEFGPQDLHAESVRVIQVTPGFRIRKPTGLWLAFDGGVL